MVDEYQLMPDWERFYLYRVESYLIHKYKPELVDEFNFTFARARAHREQVLKQTGEIVHSKEELLMRIADDLQTHAPWKPKKNDHKRESSPRPGIGEGYQQEFREL